MVENSELRNEARLSLEGKWGLAIGTIVVYWLISGVVQSIPYVGWIVGIAIGGPLYFGLITFFLNISRGDDAALDNIFIGFKDGRFEKNFITYILMTVLIFLWSLLLIVPGIIKGIAYSQAFYLMTDDPELSGMDALNKSEEMMDGHKMRYFILALSFLPWALLCILTFGIGFLWLAPYIQVTFAKFYDDLKGEDISGGGYKEQDILDSDLI